MTLIEPTFFTSNLFFPSSAAPPALAVFGVGFDLAGAEGPASGMSTSMVMVTCWFWCGAGLLGRRGSYSTGLRCCYLEVVRQTQMLCLFWWLGMWYLELGSLYAFTWG